MTNDAWDLVNLLKVKYLIGTTWVYKTKYKYDGTIDKYKSRLVAKLYAHKENIDYIETLLWKNWIQSRWFLH